jgi:hypothetical protein
MKRLLYIIIFAGGVLISTAAKGQCPMCRSAVESAMQNEDNKKGTGLNDGIVYLLAAPYLAVAFVGGVWYYRKKSK